MKYLHFAEDHRPPYFGTFSKHSSLIAGKRPLHRDEEVFNYEYDSEAEWEEEEEGEDLGESDDGDEEPADDLVYDEFFCKDDDLGSDAVSHTMFLLHCCYRSMLTNISFGVDQLTSGKRRR